ncbi:helicase HerA-like domain-containing protein [Rhodoblastus sp.]|uniref:helicase HerA-like domain-containing protein n=1 Tax=Rhodoblastus sp. TaxID=1962975 RepID=UPI0035B29951
MTDDPQNVPGKILVGKAEDYIYLLLRYGNRHGLVAGATGTGKTVTLQKLAEGFCNAGTCVFTSDVKGDLSGISMPGNSLKPMVDRAAEIGVPYEPDQFRCVFWDVFGENGHPVRATIAEMGPLLLSRILQLNDVQVGVLNIVFRVADEQGLALLDLKDLRAMLGFVSENASDLQQRYGNVSAASVGAIQRQLLVLENQGADKFFGEPALDILDLLKPDIDGRGFIHVLKAEKLVRSPNLYATFLFWLLSELFAKLPEVGDPDKPKLVFFFDEAHFLFDDAPKDLLRAIEQVVRLIRSKGIGVYFVTQSPLDVPETVLGQLGNRVQHALRAFTPRDQKAVKTAADTFRQNPNLNTADVITKLNVGEALVSTLEASGTPAMVTRVKIAPPASRVGPITAAELAEVQESSPFKGKYDQAVDRESAFEILQKRTQDRTSGAPVGQDAQGGGGILSQIGSSLEGLFRSSGKRPSVAQSAIRSAATSAARQVGSAIAKEILRGITGGVK